MGSEWSCPGGGGGGSDADYADYDDGGALNGSLAFNASLCNCTLEEHVYIEACACDYPVAPDPPLQEVLPLGYLSSPFPFSTNCPVMFDSALEAWCMGWCS